MPSYPGGEDALKKFIQNNIKYPQADRENKIEGRVVVGLVVERDGSVSNVAVKKGLSTAIDEEAVRIIRLLKFTPGTQNGTTVRVAFVIPVYFKL
jgi:protein TonB